MDYSEEIDNIHNNLQSINSTLKNINNTLLKCSEIIKDILKNSKKEIPELTLDIYQCILLQSEPSDYKNLFLTSKKFKPKDNVLIILKQRFENKYCLWEGSLNAKYNDKTSTYEGDWVGIKNLDKMYNTYMSNH